MGLLFAIVLIYVFLLVFVAFNRVITTNDRGLRAFMLLDFCASIGLLIWICYRWI
jgi:hypothetical protein